MSGIVVACAVALFASAVVLRAALMSFTASTTRRVERALPPAGAFVDIDGARIHYIDRGQSPVTLLLLHGLGGNVMHFTHSVVDRLARDFRVVVMERPGSGYSTRAVDAAAGPLAQAGTVADSSARSVLRCFCVNHPPCSRG